MPLQTSWVFLTAIYCFQVSRSTDEDPRDSRRICSNGLLLQQVGARYLPIYLSSKLSSAFARVQDHSAWKRGLLLSPSLFCCQRKRSSSRHLLLPRENQPGTSTVTSHRWWNGAPRVWHLHPTLEFLTVAFLPLADYSNISLDIPLAENFSG